jgi:hypothetical protein
MMQSGNDEHDAAVLFLGLLWTGSWCFARIILPSIHLAAAAKRRSRVGAVSRCAETVPSFLGVFDGEKPSPGAGQTRSLGLFELANEIPA